MKPVLWKKIIWKTAAFDIQTSGVFISTWDESFTFLRYPRIAMYWADSRGCGNGCVLQRGWGWTWRSAGTKGVCGSVCVAVCWTGNSVGRYNSVLTGRGSGERTRTKVHTVALSLCYWKVSLLVRSHNGDFLPCPGVRKRLEKSVVGGVGGWGALDWAAALWGCSVLGAYDSSTVCVWWLHTREGKAAWSDGRDVFG